MPRLACAGQGHRGVPAGADLLRIGRHAGFVDGFRALPGYADDIDRVRANPLKGIGL